MPCSTTMRSGDYIIDYRKNISQSCNFRNYCPGIQGNMLNKSTYFYVYVIYA